MSTIYLLSGNIPTVTGGTIVQGLPGNSVGAVSGNATIGLVLDITGTHYVNSGINVAGTGAGAQYSVYRGVTFTGSCDLNVDDAARDPVLLNCIWNAPTGIIRDSVANKIHFNGSGTFTLLANCNIVSVNPLTIQELANMQIQTGANPVNLTINGVVIPLPAFYNGTIGGGIATLPNIGGLTFAQWALAVQAVLLGKTAIPSATPGASIDYLGQDGVTVLVTGTTIGPGQRSSVVIH